MLARRGTAARLLLRTILKIVNAPPTPPIPVSRLRAGAYALVTAVEGAHAVVERLAALGVVPGTALRVVSTGATMAVAFGESRVALGRAWAAAIQVQPL